MIKLIELFAGVGTQRKALEQLSEINTIGISEIDPRALKVYDALFPHTFNFGDITQISDLPYADIWTYSFPCTDISIAGKQIGLLGSKSGLLYEVLRLLKKSPKPKCLIMENVSNLVSPKFLLGFEDWIKALQELGYKTFWKKMKASEYNGMTIRNRVFAVSVLADMDDFHFPKKTNNYLVMKDILDSPLSENFVDNSTLFKELPCNYTSAITIADYHGGGQGNRIYSIYGKGITLTATGGGKGGSSGLYCRPEGIYKLSGKEMCRAMGWDELSIDIINSVASTREIGFLMGNAIDLNLFSLLMQAVVEQYFNGGD